MKIKASFNIDDSITQVVEPSNVDDLAMQIIELATQAIETQDTDLAFKVCDMLIQLAQGQNNFSRYAVKRKGAKIHKKHSIEKYKF